MVLLFSQKHTRLCHYDWLYLTAEKPQCRISSQKVYYCIPKLHQCMDVGAAFFIIIIISRLIGFVMMWVLLRMTLCFSEDLNCLYHLARFGKVEHTKLVLQPGVMSEAPA